MRVGIIGLGNFGTAIANLAAGNGYEVLGWEFNSEVVEDINQNHKNARFLAGVDLNTKLKATHNIEEVCQSEVLFVALPSPFIPQVLGPWKDRVPADTLVVNLAKGIEASTGRTAFQMLSDLFPAQRKALLSGPSIANEFAREMPTTVVIAGAVRQDLLQIARILDTPTFRTRFSDDVIGVELGGILKNIYAIGLGIFSGIGVESINFWASYLTLSMEEIARIGSAMGAKVETFLFLAGVGDLLATSLSEHSHNRHFGEQLGKGRLLDDIRVEMGVLPEGYRTLQQILYMAEKLHVSVPLASGLWDVMEGKLSPAAYIDTVVRL